MWKIVNSGLGTPLSLGREETEGNYYNIVLAALNVGVV